MAAPAGFAYSFRGLCITHATGAAFIAGHDESTRENIPVSEAFRWDGRWSQQRVPFVANSICSVPERGSALLNMGVGGWILRWSESGSSEERVDASDSGPQNYGDLTEVRTIADEAYVVGMSRTVYRRENIDRWTRIDRGVRTSDDDESDAGFTSIHGFSGNDIYAVGWDGEIWHYDGTSWEKLDSPTNTILWRVVCGGDGKVYACGQGGIILVGRGSEWSVVEQGRTRETFWGATWFKNELYLSTSKSLYVLRSGEVEQLSVGSSSELVFSKSASFYRLDSSEERLWSAGRKMILYTDDGVNWTEPHYP